MSKPGRLYRIASPVALVLLVSVAMPRPAQADFFDGARKAFQTDIPHFFTKDVPHFFQDDVPCAFGGQPTSGTKSSCSSKGGEATPTPPAEPPPSGDKVETPPLSSSQ